MNKVITYCLAMEKVITYCCLFLYYLSALYLELELLTECKYSFYLESLCSNLVLLISLSCELSIFVCSTPLLACSELYLFFFPSAFSQLNSTLFSISFVSLFFSKFSLRLVSSNLKLLYHSHLLLEPECCIKYNVMLWQSNPINLEETTC